MVLWVGGLEFESGYPFGNNHFHKESHKKTNKPPFQTTNLYPVEYSKLRYKEIKNQWIINTVTYLKKNWVN